MSQSPLAPSPSGVSPTAAEPWLAQHRQQLEQALEQALARQAPAALDVAMRYAVLGGGKRLRGLLVLAAAEAVDALGAAAWRAACAVELVHAYSLVHDDLPCMDNDLLRRGKPTVHVQFGEAQALLAGDALQALAFDLLTPDTRLAAEATVQAAHCRLLARGAGAWGMAGGQAIDLAVVGRSDLSAAELQHMHELKTGALLRASVALGAACGQPPEGVSLALDAYGQAIGLAFQIVDDILDCTADAATLGKTAGKDLAQGKPTYVSVWGLERAQQIADGLLAEALAALVRSGLPDTRRLETLAHLTVDRRH